MTAVTTPAMLCGKCSGNLCAGAQIRQHSSSSVVVAQTWTSVVNNVITIVGPLCTSISWTLPECQDLTMADTITFLHLAEACT